MAHFRKRMLSVFLTTKCNLGCSYCFTQGVRGNDTIPWEFAKLGIDNFIVNQDYRHIRFSGGGEPTTEFDLMKKIYDYAISQNLELTSEIQSNGIFKHQVTEWLAKNVDIIWISCDGPPDIQDKDRPLRNKQKSSPILEQNIKYLTKFGKGMTGIRATITSDNLFRQEEILEYYKSLGIRYVWSDPVFPAVYVKEQEISEIDMMEYAREFVNAQRVAKRLDMVYGSILTCNFDEEIIYHCRACLPTPHLTTDGYISACDMALFGENSPSHMDVFIYGKWDKNNNKLVFDQNKIDQLRLRSVDNMIGCADCEAKSHCGGYCLGETVNEQGSLFEKKSKVCKAIKYLLKNYAPPEGGYRFLHP